MKQTAARVLFALLVCASLPAPTRGFGPNSCAAAGNNANTCIRGLAFSRITTKDAASCCQACTAAASNCTAWQFEAHPTTPNNCMLKPTTNTFAGKQPWRALARSSAT